MAKTKKTLGFKIPEDKPINLPTTEHAFDLLVKEVIDRYNLPDSDHAAAIIAQRIMHTKVDEATTTLRYLGHSVLRNIAFQVAQSKGSKIAHRHQIDDLVSQLKANPNDQQVRDALVKAVNEGSEYAKEKVDGLDLPLAKSPEDAGQKASQDGTTLQ